MKIVKNHLYLAFSAICTVWISCASPEEKMQNEISNMEKDLYKDSVMVPNPAVAGKIIDLYLSYAQKFPNDTGSASCLFKAANVASKINETDQAVQIFGQLISTYPDDKNAPYALFLQGFIYENQVGDPMKAKPYYEEFLKKYPDHAIAHDVAFSLENLGKSPEDLILEFEKNGMETVDDQPKEVVNR